MEVVTCLVVVIKQSFLRCESGKDQGCVMEHLAMGMSSWPCSELHQQGIRACSLSIKVTTRNLQSEPKGIPKRAVLQNILPKYLKSQGKLDTRRIKGLASFLGLGYFGGTFVRTFVGVGKPRILAVLRIRKVSVLEVQLIQ
eukprot:2257165-Amphidinium_carterae.1